MPKLTLGRSRFMDRPTVDRRQFLVGTAGGLAAAMFGSWPMPALPATETAPPAHSDWDTGVVRHLLPTVSDTRMLLKASFHQPLSTTPRLHIQNKRFGSVQVPGRMNDTSGELWQFYAEDLRPAHLYRLVIRSSDGKALCEPWTLSTFPAPNAQPERARILFYTCAGGWSGTYAGIGDRSGGLPAAIRNRLLRRGLAYSPDAVIANGDHIYWDLHRWQGDSPGTLSERGEGSNFDFSDAVINTRNETSLKLAAEPQIVPVYGTDFRSTPVFFLQDDHDHWENDSPVTYPVAWFQLQLARATQQLYYPEFLPDSTRPSGLPWSSMSDRGNLSESFGTLRYGRLAEILLYDVRRTMTVSDLDAVFVDRQVEKWLLERTNSRDTRHLVHVPSNPPGWTAGKWGEWYPDTLDPETGKLTTRMPKPYWRQGWLDQHDRLMQSLSGMKDRVPVVVSGDLHAIGMGEIHRSGEMDFSANPVTTILSGPIGTSPFGFPSAVRGSRPLPAKHLDLNEEVAPVEEHGFTLVDFLPDRMVVQLFKWDVNSQSLDDIDSLQPFHITELARDG